MKSTMKLMFVALIVAATFGCNRTNTNSPEQATSTSEQASAEQDVAASRAIAADEDGTLIQTVKSACLPEDKSVTIGQVLDGHPELKMSSWTAETTPQGRRLVIFMADVNAPAGSVVGLHGFQSMSMSLTFVVNLDGTVQYAGGEKHYVLEGANAEQTSSNISSNDLQRIWAGQRFGYITKEEAANRYSPNRK